MLQGPSTHLPDRTRTWSGNSKHSAFASYIAIFCNKNLSNESKQI